MSGGLVSLSFAALLAGAAFGSPFRAPLRVSDGTGTSGDLSLAVDALDYPLLAYCADRGLLLARGSNRFSTSIPVPGPIEGASAPSIAATPVGTSWIAFEAPDPDEGTTRIWLTGNPGGGFLPPTSLGEGRSPSVGISSEGEVIVVRESVGPFGPEVVISRAEEEIVRFAGRDPSFIPGLDGRIHVAWIADGDLAVADGIPPDLSVRRWTASEEEEEEPRIALLPGQEPVVLYRVGREYFLRSAASVDAIPILSCAESPGGSSLDVTPDGMLHAAIADGADLILASGQFGSPPTAMPIARAEDAILSPRIRADGFGVLHIAYCAGGEIWYANDAASPRPDFEAEPAEGEPPLSVRFRSLSGGEIRGWRWEFGDGGVSTLPDPVHTYADPGAYTVRLTVEGAAGETESVARESAVVVRQPRNLIVIPDAVLLPGLKGTYLPVLGTHADPIQGFQLSLRYDPLLLDVVDVVLDGTAPQAYAPEFFVPRIYADEGAITVGLYLDVNPPFDGRTIPRGLRQRLVNLIVDVPGKTPSGIVTEIAPRDGAGQPPIRNIFTVQGYSVFPLLRAGRVRVIPFELPFPRLFIRGDVDANGIVVLSDPILILKYLFAGGTPPSCLDSADVDDNGSIDIADPVLLLEYLFAYGRAPEVPFPSYGLDPTPDDLPGC